MKKLMSQIYEEVEQLLDDENYLSKIDDYYEKYNEMCENGELENDLSEFEVDSIEARLSKMYNKYLKVLDESLSEEDL